MTNDELNKPRKFEIFYSGLAGTFSVRNNYSAFLMNIQNRQTDEYIYVIELAPMLKMMEKMKNKLIELENYLYFNGDNLCGDDLIGDQRFTKRFEEVTRDITVTLQSYKAFKRENGLE